MQVVALSDAAALLKEGRGGDSIGVVVHGVGREETGEVEQKNLGSMAGYCRGTSDSFAAQGEVMPTGDKKQPPLPEEGKRRLVQFCARGLLGINADTICRWAGCRWHRDWREDVVHRRFQGSRRHPLGGFSLGFPETVQLFRR